MRWLGRMAYEEAWEWQRRMKARVAEGGHGVIGVVEHDPVYTVGRNEARRTPYPSIINGTPVIETDRGGKITWHGPGQAVIYPILRPGDFGLGVGDWVRLLEQTGIGWLAGLGIEASCLYGHPGVWVGSTKVMALGCNIQGGISTHGVALNLRVPMSAYSHINPCGITDPSLGVGSLDRLIPPAAVPSVEEAGRAFAERLVMALLERA